MNVKHFIGVACVASVVLVGCYGETRPATNLRPNGAALQGHFTANNGAGRELVRVLEDLGAGDRLPDL